MTATALGAATKGDSLTGLALVVVAVVVFGIVVLVLRYVSSRDVRRYAAARTSREAEREAKLTELRLASRTSVAQAIAGILLIGTLAVTAWQANGARRTAADARRMAAASLGVAEAGQVTERFARAVEQLGATTRKDKAATDVRIGALFALKRIGEDSRRDRQPVLLTVANYVKNNIRNAPWGSGPPLRLDACFNPRRLKRRANLRADVRVALLYVLPSVERAWPRPNGGFSFGLDFANFTGVNIGSVAVIGLDLEGALFRDANLGSALFKRTLLEGTSFRGACLFRADFSDGANRFDRLDLRGANLREAQVPVAYFHNAVVDSQTRVDGLVVGGKPLAQACEDRDLTHRVCTFPRKP